MKGICATAAEHKIAVCLGFFERENNSLYISQATINADGEILGVRRKIKATHMKRTVFGDATGGDTLRNVVPIPGVGKVGPEIHVAAWPPVGEHEGGPGLWSMSCEGARNLSRTFSMECGAFVLHTTAVISDAGIEKMGLPSGVGMFGVPGGGSSAIFGPDGRQLSENIPETEKGISYAELDFDNILRSKSFVDICGHYSRPDMLWLGVDPVVKLSLR